MMVYFSKQLPETVASDSNERIVLDGLNQIRAFATEDHDQVDNEGGVGCACYSEQQHSSKMATDN